MSIHVKYKVHAYVLGDGHVDPTTGPRCMIKPTEGEHKGLYLVAHTTDVLKNGQPVIYDYISRRAALIPMTPAKEIAMQIEKTRAENPAYSMVPVSDVRVLISALCEADKERDAWKERAIPHAVMHGRMKAAEAELATANDDARITNELLNAAIDDHNGALAELAQARKALKFYATEANWTEPNQVNIHEIFDTPMGDDLGKIARDTLSAKEASDA